MGWKVSMIIIENGAVPVSDETILSAIGMGHLKPLEDCTFEEAMYNRDAGIALGQVNNNTVICDKYLMTAESLERIQDLSLTAAESSLSSLFPDTEILSVACHSTVNYHGYSLIKNGEKQRLKYITADEPRRAMGKDLEEEAAIYARSHRVGEQYFWTIDGDEYQEDQLMEEFTFELAKRRLGFRLDMSNDIFFEERSFRKYGSAKGEERKASISQEPKESKGFFRRLFGI